MNLRSRNKVEVGFSMSSMTDVVFLLLIFFIISSTLISPYGLKLELPGGTVKNVSKTKLVISIDENEDIYYQKEISSIEEIKQILKAERGELPPEKAIVELRPYSQTPITIVTQLMEIAKKNNYTFVIATEPI